MIYVKPVFGLCNRIRAIGSAYALALDRGDSLVVYWTPDSGMSVAFSGIFVATEKLAVVEDRSLDERFSTANDTYFKDDGLGRSEFVARVLDSDQDRDYYIESYGEFYRCDFSWLKAHPDVIAIVERERMRLGSDYIGVHVRRTDNLESIAKSPIGLFIKEMRTVIAGRPSVRFYVATDDERVRATLAKKFGRHVVVRTEVASRWSEFGMRDAMVDLLLLASASRIIGSWWSSYSSVAGLMGDVPVDVICDNTWRVPVRRFFFWINKQFQRGCGVIARREIVGRFRRLINHGD